MAHSSKDSLSLAELCQTLIASQQQAPTNSEFMTGHYSSCMMCHGYYGQNFGQPVCSTCHLFLFSSDVDAEDGHEQDDQHKKAESDDSGTEEPDYECDFFMNESLEPHDWRQGRQLYTRSDRLAERLTALSLPRKCDRVPPGLVDSLPPEVLLVVLRYRDISRMASNVLRQILAGETILVLILTYLPSSVLLVVFRYLDDISRWTASNVCRRWRQILAGETTQNDWEHFVMRRWPLFRPRYRVACWRSMYSRLLESSPCRLCLEGMMLQSTPPIEENSWRHRRLRSELKTLKSDPPEGIQATPLDRHCCHWQASITGPRCSPYQGGVFLIYLQIPQTYPMKPPKVRFITRIFHPNISRHGDVGLDSIHHNWSLALTISKVLISIQSLLTDPYCSICMEPEIAQFYQENRCEYERIARLWTWKYAMLDYMPPCTIDMNSV